MWAHGQSVLFPRACRWSSSRLAGVPVVVGDVAVWFGELDEPHTKASCACARSTPPWVPAPVARISRWPLAFFMADAYHQRLVSLC